VEAVEAVDEGGAAVGRQLVQDRIAPDDPGPPRERGRGSGVGAGERDGVIGES
jgi:hypothetical protein